MLRLPLVILPKYRKYLCIESKYKTNNLIIPIGCDCHPAYTLKSLHIRKESLPFDWLNTDSLLGIQYVKENIENNFAGFLKDLYRNENGHIVSGNYSFAEFLHEKDLIENEATQLKIKKRVARFVDLYKSNDCHFLYNIKSNSLTSSDSVIAFTKTVNDFIGTIKETDKLSIYIRFDESLNENRQNCDNLFNDLKKINKVSVTKYIRGLEKFGMWGDPLKYPALYRELGINLKWNLLKIYTKNFCKE